MAVTSIPAHLAELAAYDSKKEKVVRLRRCIGEAKEQRTAESEGFTFAWLFEIIPYSKDMLDFCWEFENYLYIRPFLAYMRQNWLDFDSTSIKVFEAFTFNYAKEKSSAEISKQMSIPKRTVSRKLKEAEEKGLIKSITQGRNKFYYIDIGSLKAFYFLLFLETHKALEFCHLNPKISFYLERIKKTKIIFGSYAKYGRGNDLDVVFFGKDTIDVSDSPVEMHQQITTVKDFKKRLDKKDSLAWEIADNHIILNDHEKVVKILMEAYDG
ncbi:MAG: helix-turn-helix domain-containing protein [Nanoarchaeota archaeon]